MMREWIIFALCLGVGGHIALGVVMHAPGLWPWSTTGFYGLLSGVAGAGMAGDMETIPARSKVPVGKRTQRLLVGAPYHFSWVGLLYVRLPSKTDRST